MNRVRIITAVAFLIGVGCSAGGPVEEPFGDGAVPYDLEGAAETDAGDDLELTEDGGQLHAGSSGLQEDGRAEPGADASVEGPEPDGGSYAGESGGGGSGGDEPEPEGGSGGNASAGGSGGAEAGSGGDGGDGPCAGADDGTNCTNDGLLGRCRSGSCCSGCGDGAVCQAGDALNVCGGMGVPCRDCDTGNPCKADECSFGISCRSTDVIDYTDCPAGQCVSGECEAVGDEDQLCEDGTDCGSGLVCADNYCRACGGTGELCCAGDSCGGGRECDDDVCRMSLVCGSEGQDCCAGNSCDGDYLHCYSGTCGCGGDGQVCCFNLDSRLRYCDSSLTCLHPSEFCT